MNFAKSDTGSSLLEFSLIVPFMVLMFLGVVDFGIAISQAMTVQDAASVGAEYGTLAGNGDDVAGMQSTATTAAHGLSGFTVVATRWCSCTPGGTVSSCTSWCGSNIPVKYVQVQTSATVNVLMGYPGLPTSIPLSGLSVLRVQ